MTEADFYVSPAGSDKNPGTKTLPFQTITAARDAARRCSHPVTVEVKAGTYAESITFQEQDSGNTYFTRENAVLTGGLKIPYEQTEAPCKEIKDRLTAATALKVRAIDLKKYGVTKEAYGTLYAIGQYSTDRKYDGVFSGCNMEVFQNGRRMIPARYPKEGYLKLEEVADVGDAAEFPPQNYWQDWENRRNHRGGIYIIDKDTNERIRRWKNPDSAWMFGYFYWDWADASTPVTFHTENRAVMPRFVSRFGARAGAQYYFYHVLEELDAPGEFYLDEEKGILYIYPDEAVCPEISDLHGNTLPLEGKGTIFEISVAQQPLIRLEGADDMTISGFTLTNVRNTAVVAEGNGNTFRNLQIRNAAVHGITVNGFRNLAEGCEIAYTGCGGIYLTGGRRDTLMPGENEARNNRIHDFSRIYQTYQAGVSLSGVGNRCAYNEIYGSPHLAVAYSGNEHVIEYNHIHDVVQHSNDAGAIYSGFDWAAHGTVIRYNLVENVGNEEFASNGIYWDDGLSGQTAYGNTLKNVKGYAILAGGGRDNTIRDNLILGECKEPIYYDDRNRDGFLNGGWAHASCDMPAAPHWRRLKAVPYTSRIWKSKYPSLAGISTDFDNPDDPAFPINPANVVIENNVMINRDARMGWLAQSVYAYNKIGKNRTYCSVKEAAIELNF